MDTSHIGGGRYFIPSFRDRRRGIPELSSAALTVPMRLTTWSPSSSLAGVFLSKRTGKPPFCFPMRSNSSPQLSVGPRTYIFPEPLVVVRRQGGS